MLFDVFVVEISICTEIYAQTKTHVLHTKSVACTCNQLVTVEVLLISMTLVGYSAGIISGLFKMVKEYSPFVQKHFTT